MAFQAGRIGQRYHTFFFPLVDFFCGTGMHWDMYMISPGSGNDPKGL
jgi:hypothetical protein